MIVEGFNKIYKIVQKYKKGKVKIWLIYLFVLFLCFLIFLYEYFPSIFLHISISYLFYSMNNQIKAYRVQGRNVS